MVAVVGTPASFVHPASSADTGTVTDQYNLAAGATLLLIGVGWEGNENPRPTNAVQWDTGGTPQTLTLLSDSGNTGSNSDIRALVYGLLNPTIGNLWFRVRNQFSADPWVGFIAGFSGVDTASLAAATNDLAQVQNLASSPTDNAAFSSAGVSGSGLLTWGVSHNESEGSVDNSFTEHVDVQSGATAGDIRGILATRMTAPSAVTTTFGGSAANAACFVELVASAAAEPIVDVANIEWSINPTGTALKLPQAVDGTMSSGIGAIGMSATGAVQQFDQVAAKYEAELRADPEFTLLAERDVVDLQADKEVFQLRADREMYKLSADKEKVTPR